MKPSDPGKSVIRSFVLIRDRQPPARFVQLLRDGPSDAPLVRQAKDHRRLLSFAHHSLVCSYSCFLIADI
jgi:hypothetical protein